MANDTPFSGGDGSGSDPVQAPIAPNPLLDLLNRASIQKYIIDAGGSDVEVTFFPQHMQVAIKTGETIAAFPYRRG